MACSYSGKRNIAFKNQSGRCYYCGAPMWQNDTCEEFARRYGISPKNAKRLQCTAEHLIAQCDGGKHTQENIVAACVCCNLRRHQRKKPMDPVRYKSHVRRRLKEGKWHSAGVGVLCKPA